MKSEWPINLIKTISSIPSSEQKVANECLSKSKRLDLLRHTFATRCIAVGMDIKSLSEILGHANVSITLNIYVHSSFETKNKFINKL